MPNWIQATFFPCTSTRSPHPQRTESRRCRSPRIWNRFVGFSLLDALRLSLRLRSDLPSSSSSSIRPPPFYYPPPAFLLPSSPLPAAAPGLLSAPPPHGTSFRSSVTWVPHRRPGTHTHLEGCFKACARVFLRKVCASFFFFSSSSSLP